METEFSIRNHLGHEVGTVKTSGDAIAAYACKVNAPSSRLREAGYKAVPLDKYRIEHSSPDQPAVLIDTADSEEDALTLASCHCENLPEKEISIIDPNGVEIT